MYTMHQLRQGDIPISQQCFREEENYNQFDPSVWCSWMKLVKRVHIKRKESVRYTKQNTL